MTLDRLNLWTPDVIAVQTRRGTVDVSDPYSQWNLCHYTGDDIRRVQRARRAFCRQMGIAPGRLVMPRQSHTTRVAVIDDKWMQADAEERERLLDNTDALVTAARGVCIGVNTADCVPIVLADREAGIVGVAHAGWRGTVGRIALHTVEQMRRLGVEPGRISAAMGASICRQCFEVGDEVPQAFAREGFDLDRIMHRDPATGKAHIDLWLANRLVLAEAGVDTGRIALPAACSRCRSDDFFSARRLGINSGRTFTAIMLRPAD